MNKLKKVGLTALAASLATFSATAGELSVTGSASIYYSAKEKAASTGFYQNDKIVFTGSGTLDNGMELTMGLSIDESDVAADQAATGRTFEGRYIALSSDTLGTLQFDGKDGSSVVSALDDKMPAAYEESFTGADAPTQGAATSNMFWYNNSSLMDGLSVDLSYTPSSTTEVEGSTEAGITYTGVEGLTLSYNKGKDKGAGALAHIDNQIFYATYAYGPVTLGFQENEADSEVADGDEDYSSMAISYAVSEELSLSYGVSKLDYESATLTDQESVSIGASYTMGSMTFSGTHNRHDNISGADASDRDWYELAVSFAF